MLWVAKEAYAQMMAHARAESPRECVGLLLGSGGEVRLSIPLPNVSAEPERAYVADPRSLLEALQTADRDGMEVLAVYHSHPGGRPRPSPTDIARAVWRTVYVIVVPETGEVGAYHLPGGEEVVLVVE